ncbi:MAG: DNA polymerase III subunit gamma/tau [Thermoclostridium sp.]|nr:DNA polymerase III subunit gamma/tau [Thermoclostridium sp.]
MVHQALYRKYRPQEFNDVIEQQHIVNTLKNIVISGNTTHAYLFSGTRGTGKTTLAKIFARAVNCLQPRQGNPCNECTVCKGILDGTILDVVEIDAASNNSVENVRGIIDEVVYTPTHARKKVYIIDEVHMLSTGAFNALLKTLEEPPQHVMFILATTEPHKLPATVLSRCQRFDFRRITPDGIAQRLLFVAQEAGVTLEKEAAYFIASLSEGAMRDGISILDQCIATGKNPLKLEDVHEIIGVAPNLLILDTAGFLTECKSKEAVEAIDQLISAGKDPAQFLQGMIQMFRDILVYKAGNSVEPLLSMTAEERTRVPILAGKVSVAEALMVVRELSDLEAGIRWSTSPRILLEMAFLRICERELNRDTDKLLDQLKLLEQRIRKLEEGIPAGHISARPATAATMPATAADAPSCTCPKPAEQQTKPQANAEALNREPFQEWDKVMDQLMRNKHMTLFTYLCVAKAVWKDENTIWIVLSDEDGKQKEFLSSAENMDITIRTIRECTGKDLQVELFKADKTGKKASKTEVPENVIQFAAKSGLKLDIVDE